MGLVFINITFLIGCSREEEVPPPPEPKYNVVLYNRYTYRDVTLTIAGLSALAKSGKSVNVASLEQGNYNWHLSYYYITQVNHSGTIEINKNMTCVVFCRGLQYQGTSAYIGYYWE